MFVLSKSSLTWSGVELLRIHQGKPTRAAGVTGVIGDIEFGRRNWIVGAVLHTSLAILIATPDAS